MEEGDSVQGEPFLETCESDISPKPYSRLTIPPLPPLTYAYEQGNTSPTYVTHRERANTQW